MYQTIFKNNLITVQRLVTVGTYKIFQTIFSNLECNLQPIRDNEIQDLNLDGVYQQFLCLIGTNEENLIQINDKIFDKKGTEYTVGSIKFFEGPVISSLELNLMKKIL